MTNRLYTAVAPASRTDRSSPSVPHEVLVAEDEKFIRALILVALGRDRRLHLTLARDGEEALAMARRKKPSAIILDVRMPKMSGLEVCEALRADEQTAGPKIIMLSALADPGDVERGVAAGADAYMTKPFDPNELLSEVQQALGIAA
jgi:CheY-like chemotaxis protein